MTGDEDLPKQELELAAQEAKEKIIGSVAPVLIGEGVGFVSSGLLGYFNGVGYTPESRKAMERILGRCIPELGNRIRGLSTGGGLQDQSMKEEGLEILARSSSVKIYAGEFREYDMIQKNMLKGWFVTVRRT